MELYVFAPPSRVLLYPRPNILSCIIIYTVTQCSHDIGGNDAASDIFSFRYIVCLKLKCPIISVLFINRDMTLSLIIARCSVLSSVEHPISSGRLTTQKTVVDNLVRLLQIHLPSDQHTTDDNIQQSIKPLISSHIIHDCMLFCLWSNEHVKIFLCPRRNCRIHVTVGAEVRWYAKPLWIPGWGWLSEFLWGSQPRVMLSCRSFVIDIR